MVPRPFMTFLVVALGLGLLSTPALARQPYAAVVVNGKGEIVHQMNAHSFVYPASLTKMMTLYLVFEALREKKWRLSDPVWMTKEANAEPPCRVDIPSGKSMTVEQAIIAMTVHSANNVAAAVGAKFGPLKAFSKKMTEKARQLGLHRTTFQNPTGLFHPEQKTTPYELALLGRALRREFPKECDRYLTIKKVKFPFDKRLYHNHNHLLKNDLGVDGIKTGFVNKSGFNSIISVQPKGKERLFLVVVGCETVKKRDAHLVKLIHAAYHKPESVPLLMAQAGGRSVFPKEMRKNSRFLVARSPSREAPSIDALLVLANARSLS